VTQWLLLFVTTSSLFTVSTPRPSGPLNAVAAPINLRMGAMLPLAVRP